MKAAFDLQPLGEIPVKGKAEPVSVFEVSRSKPHRKAAVVLRSCIRRWWGGTNELAMLQRRCRP